MGEEVGYLWIAEVPIQAYVLAARSVPMRPIKNVFIHVRRVWEPVAKQGPWSGREDEDLEK